MLSSVTLIDVTKSKLIDLQLHLIYFWLVVKMQCCEYFWPIGKVQRCKPHPQSSCTFEKFFLFGGVKEICSKGFYSLGKVHTVQTELHLHLNSCLPEKVKLSNIPKNLSAELLFLLSCIINHSLGRRRGPDTPNHHQRAGCITSRCTWTHRKHYSQRPNSSYYLHPCQRR